MARSCRGATSTTTITRPGVRYTGLMCRRPLGESTVGCRSLWHRIDGKAGHSHCRLPAGRATAGGRHAPPPPASVGATAPASPRVQTLEINKSHNGQLARVRVGNVLVIRLPGDPATGYQWQVASTNSPAVRMTVRPQYSPPASTAAGAAAGHVHVYLPGRAAGNRLDPPLLRPSRDPSRRASDALP